MLWPNFRLEFLHSILNLISPGINQVFGVSISVNISFWIDICAEIFASKHRVHEHQKLENFENSQTSRNWSENWFLSTYELRKRSRVLAARIFNMTRRAVSRRVIPIQRVTWPSLGLDFFHFFVVENKGFSIFYQRQSAWNLSAPRFKITSDQSGPRHHSGTRGQRL